MTGTMNGHGHLFCAFSLTKVNDRNQTTIMSLDLVVYNKDVISRK